MTEAAGALLDPEPSMHMRILTLLAIALAVACGEEEPAPRSAPPMEYEGTLGTPIQGSYRLNLIYVPMAVAGGPAREVAVDTGAPITVIDPLAFPEWDGASSTDVTVGPLAFRNVPTASLSPCGTAACPLDLMNGLLGGNVLRSFAVSFNYRDAQLTFGPLPEPSGVEAARQVPFVLEGGGLGALPDGKLVSLPATRISVKANLEGRELDLILDTGASMIALRREVMDALLADGRARMAGPDAMSVTGVVDTRIARARSLSIGDVAVSELPVADVEMPWEALEGEVRHDVDGLLGGTFLRHFLVTIDYPGQVLLMRRYVEPTHFADEYRRAPITLGADVVARNYSYFVDALLGAAATDGTIPACFVGGRVQTIAGTSVAGLDPEQADRLLCGAVGTTRRVEVLSGCDRTTPIAVDFRVEELLPLP